MINLSKKTDYGFYLLALLAESKKPLSLKDIALKHQMSFQYLQEVAQTLRRIKLINALRGASGGYILTKKPSQISALKIINVLEGPHFKSTCQCTSGEYHCQRSKNCRCRPGFDLIKNKVLNSLKKLTLQDFLKQK